MKVDVLQTPGGCGLHLEARSAKTSSFWASMEGNTGYDLLATRYSVHSLNPVDVVLLLLPPHLTVGQTEAPGHGAAGPSWKVVGLGFKSTPIQCWNPSLPYTFTAPHRPNQASGGDSPSKRPGLLTPVPSGLHWSMEEWAWGQKLVPWVCFPCSFHRVWSKKCLLGKQTD